MKQSSEYCKMKVMGRIIVCGLFVLVMILLFYNNKITKSDTALAKGSKTTKPSSSIFNLPTFNYVSKDFFIQNNVFKSDSNEITHKKLSPGSLDSPSNKLFLNDQHKMNSDKQISQTISTHLSKQHSIESDERNLGKQTEWIKQDNLKSPITKKQKVVYLTFDDGPSVVSTQILALLNKYHAKATFFMLDPNIKRYSTAVKQMVKEGNSIGSHGVTHDIHKIYRSPDSFVKEMKQTEQTLKRITGKDSSLIRVPYGSVPYMKPAFRKASDSEGFLMWDWDIDSDDWQTSHGEFVQNIKTQVVSCSGERPLVILMHEKISTVKYLEQVLQYFQQKGYKMEAITENLKPVQFKYRKN